MKTKDSMMKKYGGEQENHSYNKKQKTLNNVFHVWKPLLINSFRWVSYCGWCVKMFNEIYSSGKNFQYNRKNKTKKLGLNSWCVCVFFTLFIDVLYFKKKHLSFRFFNNIQHFIPIDALSHHHHQWCSIDNHHLHTHTHISKSLITNESKFF